LRYAGEQISSKEQGRIRVVPSAYRLLAFAIATVHLQEALTNARKHSGAHNVHVKVKSVDKHLKVSITDDGCGFSKNRPQTLASECTLCTADSHLVYTFLNLQ
jgi:signal transduction histidine kinase